MSAALWLYECVDDLLTVRDWLDEHADQVIEAGGDIAALPELAALIDQAEGDFEAKVQRVALFILELTRTADAVAEEAKRLTARAARDKKSADALKHYLLLNMTRAECKKVEGKLATVRVQASPAAVHSALTDGELADLWARPDNKLVRRIPETYKLDARAVIEAEALGEPIPAGVTVTRASHVRIA